MKTYPYQHKTIANSPTFVLLYEVMARGDVKEAPIKTEWAETPFGSIVGIGNDHTANITLSTEDWSMLCKMVAEYTGNLSEE